MLTVNIGLNASSIVNLNGAITQGSAGTPLLLHGTGTNTSATVNIAGDITGAGTNGSAVIQSDNAAGKFTTNITGNFYGGKYGTLYLDYAGTITITGSVATNTTTADSGVVAINSGALTLNWAGTLIGSTVGQGYALKQGAGTVTITGNVTGGSANDSYGVDVISGTCTVNGIATGGTGLRAYGVLNNTGTSSVTVDTATGNGYGPGGATNPVPGVWGNNGASLTTKVKKIISGAYGQSGVGGAVLLLSDAANKSTMRTVYNGATRDLVPSGGAFNPVGSAIIGAGMQV